MTGRTRRPTRLELAANLVVGEDATEPALPEASRLPDPSRALEEAVLPALARPPCLVSFSGGRDSSSVLAVAVRAARREGLPLPVPATWRFPSHPDTEESSWQELVVEHLRLEDWHRPAFTDELDLLGPVARRSLLRHGLLYPPNLHAHVPLLEAARGGSLLTGVDGDGLLEGWRWAHVASVLARRTRPAPRDVLRLGLAVAPSRLQRAWERRRSRLPVPWLRERARTTIEDAWLNDQLDEPVRWDRRLARYARRRYLLILRDHFRVLAEAADADVLHPLMDRGFLATLARHGREGGYGGRPEAMRVLFGGLLPEDVLLRRDKADFTLAFWGEQSRAFTRDWSGRGIPDELVDPRRLRAAWAEEQPNFQSALLLQAAWLSSAIDGSFDEAYDYRGSRDGEGLPFPQSSSTIGLTAELGGKRDGP